jgi:hypothetical protein
MIRIPFNGATTASNATAIAGSGVTTARNTGAAASNATLISGSGATTASNTGETESDNALLTDISWRSEMIGHNTAQ